MPAFSQVLVDELVAKGCQQGREELVAKAAAMLEELKGEFESLSEELAAPASVDRCFSLVSHLIHNSVPAADDRCPILQRTSFGRSDLVAGWGRRRGVVGVARCLALLQYLRCVCASRRFSCTDQTRAAAPEL